MSIFKSKLIWTPQDEAIPQQNIEDFVSINARKGLDVKMNQIDIKLSNAFKKYVNADDEIQFEEGDSIKFYARYVDDNTTIDTSATSPDLIMSAEVIELEAELSEKNTMLTLKCADKSFSILNSLHVQNYKETDINFNKPHLIIKNILQNANDGAGNGTFAISAFFDQGDSEVGFIQSKKSDGTNFNTIGMAKVFKPVYEWIINLSNTDNTGDNKSYVFYVDELNRFHWFYPKDAAQTALSFSITSAATTINVISTVGFSEQGRISIDSELIEYTGKTATSFTGATRGTAGTIAISHNSGAIVSDSLRFIEGDNSTGNEMLNFKLSNKVFDVVNFVIFNAGEDMNSNGISNYFFDSTSGSKKLKPTSRKFLKLAELMKERDRVQGNITKNNNGSYNFPTLYPVIPAWNPSITVNSDFNYNFQFRKKAVELGKGLAREITRFRGEARWKGTIEVKGKNYVAGNLITFTSPSLGLKDIFLRIKDIRHNIGKSGWFTTLEVEEDERTLVVI